MLANVAGAFHVVGVNSAVFPDSAPANGVHAPTFTKESGDFLRFHLNISTPSPPLDLDDDGVVDTRDNCPRDANRGQIDRDADGVGDVCDNCAATDAFFHARDYNGNQELRPNPDQANCNDEAESERLVNAGIVEDYDVSPISLESYLRRYAPPLLFGDPLLCDAFEFKFTRRIQRGDACDDVPCALTTVETGTPTDTSDLGPFLCPDKQTIGTCAYEVPTAHAMFPIIEPADSGANGDIGLRHCQCPNEHATEIDRRKNCGAGTIDDCAIDPTRYIQPPLGDTRWRRMSLGGQTPADDVLTGGTFGVVTDFPTASVSWDSLSDLALLTGQALPPKPWMIGADGSIQGGPRLNGIVWAMVRTIDGLPVSALQDGFDRPFDEYSHRYAPLDHRFVANCNCEEIDELKPAFPWEYCVSCFPDGTAGWLEVINPGLVLSVGPETIREVTRGISSTARALLSSTLTRVLASEPEYRLRQARIERREIFVDTPTLRVFGKIGIDSGAVTGSVRRVTGNDRTPVGLEAADSTFPSSMLGGALSSEAISKHAYSATQDNLFAIVQSPGIVPTAGYWSGADEIWHELPLVLVQPLTPDVDIDCHPGGTCVPRTRVPVCHKHRVTLSLPVPGAKAHLRHGDTLGRCAIRLGEPLALTFHVDDDALYLLDQVHGRVRLLRIHLVSGVVELLHSELSHEVPEVVSLSIGYGGELLIAMANAGTTALVHVLVEDDVVSVRDAMVITDPTRQLAGGLVLENRIGAHYLSAGSTGFRPQLALRSSFIPRADPRDCRVLP